MQPITTHRSPTPFSPSTRPPISEEFFCIDAKTAGAVPPSQTGNNAITASCAKIFHVIAAAGQSASKITSKDPVVAAARVSKKMMAAKDANLVGHQKTTNTKAAPKKKTTSKQARTNNESVCCSGVK